MRALVRLDRRVRRHGDGAVAKRETLQRYSEMDAAVSHSMMAEASMRCQFIGRNLQRSCTRRVVNDPGSGPYCQKHALQVITVAAARFRSMPDTALGARATPEPHDLVAVRVYDSAHDGIVRLQGRCLGPVNGGGEAFRVEVILTPSQILAVTRVPEAVKAKVEERRTARRTGGR